MLKGLLRIVAELVLSGPIFFFYPFLAFSAAHTVYDLVVRPDAIGLFSLVFVAGGVGLTGLYLAIVSPTRLMQARPGIKWVLTGMIATGLVLATLFLALGGEQPLVTGTAAWSAWAFGGPVLAALTTLRRIHRRPEAALRPPQPAASSSSGA